MPGILQRPPVDRPADQRRQAGDGHLHAIRHDRDRAELRWTGAMSMIAVITILLLTGQTTGRASPAEPAESPGTWVGFDDYPADAIRRHEQGRVTYALSIDAAGRVTACTVKTSSGSSTLDEATCAIAMKKAHFTPAHDDKGGAIPSTWSSAVRWVLPTMSTAIDLTLGDVRMADRKIEVMLDPTGKSRGCTVVPPSTTGPDPCAQFPLGKQVGPALSKAGKPVEGVMTLEFTQTYKAKN
ncbi:energy transducer TonB [Sphingomonas koreensis]|nr:energy transducer TonB [Sphingomonas koreensis]